MITLGEICAEKREEMEVGLRRLEALEQLIRESGLADVSVPHAVFLLPDWLAISDEEYECPDLAVRLLNLSGKQRVMKTPGNSFRFFCGTRDSGSSYRTPVIELRRGSQHCRKARVVEEKVIEVCGDLDESKYLEVEYLE